ncbi:hypothetical protein [Fusicatenibacter saccharivorans]|jgi:hypothetical protein
MIYFDELSVAQEMEASTTAVDEYKRSDLLLYAKYLRYKAITESGKDYNNVTVEDMEQLDSQIEKELKAFCNRYYIDFNYIVKFQDIDNAVASSRLYKLKLPLPTPITKKEWEKICTIENDNYRRMLFVMLVDAKYHRLHSISIENSAAITEDTLFYCHMEKRDIYKAGACKFKNAEEKNFSLGCLYREGVFDITNNKYRSWFVKFVDISDDSGDVLDYITDYDHLNLHYERLCGKKIGTCKICGKLFKQGKTKTSDYCYKHRGYNKKNIKKLICVDCGKQFMIGSKSRKSCRCSECQSKETRRLKREWWHKNKNKESLEQSI